MGNQHWDQELQGEEGMRALRLPSNFMEAQINILNSHFEGLVDTMQNRCKLDTLAKYVSGNKQLTSKVVSKEYKKSLLEFENHRTTL